MQVSLKLRMGDLFMSTMTKYYYFMTGLSGNFVIATDIECAVDFKRLIRNYSIHIYSRDLSLDGLKSHFTKAGHLIEILPYAEAPYINKIIELGW